MPANSQLRHSTKESGRTGPDQDALIQELAAAKAHIRNLIELNPQIVFITDAEGQLCDIARTWLDWAGLTLDEALGLGWMAALHLDDVEPTLSEWQRCLRTGDHLDMEYRLRSAGGSYTWFRARAVPLRDEQGNILRWYGAAEDIHDRKLINAALRESEAFSRSILRNSPDVIMVVDDEWRLEFLSERGQKAFDIAVLGDVKHRPWLDLWPESAREVATRAILGVRPGASTRFTTSRERQNGVQTWWDVSVSSFLARRDGGQKVLAIARDVTEAKLAEETLERAAFTDPLTGLANRVVYREALKAVMDAGEDGTALLIDLDDFKAVNDLLGHLTGDELLRQAALRLKGCVRGADIVARLGGDEFAVLLRGAPISVGRSMAARMIERLCEPFKLEGRLVTISASIGITRLSADSADNVLRQADIALYSAKRSQSGTSYVYDEKMGRTIEERHSLIMDLRSALSRNEFVLEYQRLVVAGSSEPVGFEALLRWQHPNHGRISPDVFVPLLEETGAITAVGEWVLHEACRQAFAWPITTTVSVNLSTVQFRSGTLVKHVSNCLKASGLAPERLQLEITESVLLEHSETNLQILHELQQLGVEIVLDDFGTGYSSLSFLRRFAFDKIKIDRSFVANMLDDEPTLAIVSTVVDLARRLDIAITAEGVETEQQYQELLRLGCPEFQGYLFARPAPPDQLGF